MDTLPQFGALVTNGQEEIASLAYLITLRWAQENTEVIREIGDLYESRMREVAAKYPAIIAGISGQRHLLGLEFHDIATARACTEALNRAGLDVSAHTYKTECPPVALTKLPLTACPVVVEFVVQRLTDTLDRLGPSKN
jgi:acetylornithine/succinyldiaminopimelate/putrescine aminotransferase